MSNEGIILAISGGLFLVTVFLYKQMSFNRWIRKLDHDERVGVARMRREWDEYQAKVAMEEFHKPLICASLLEGKDERH